jgi:hypothetical protein
METQNLLISQDDQGGTLYSRTTVKYTSTQTIITIGQINSFFPSDLILGTTCLAEYWADPTLGSGEYNNSADKNHDNQGIVIVFNISDCSGIYSKNPITDWNNSKYIEIDDSTRPDMKFVTGGDHKIYLDTLSTLQIGYWAYGENLKITLTNSSGVNLLFGASEQVIKSLVWHYNQTGYFNLYIGLKLDLSNAGGAYSFTSPDFVLNDCIMNIKMLDMYGGILVEKTYNNVFIDPPNVVGSITTTTSFKTISDINYIMTRDAVRGNTTYTEIHDVRKHIYSLLNSSLKDGTPRNYKNDNISSDSFSISISEMGKGDYAYVSYEPKLAGIKSDGVIITDFITNCTGHKFSISNGTLQFSVSGVFSSDILDEISNQNPYIFIDPINSSGDIKATFDINHDNWTTNTPRDNLSDNNIYPYISSVYIIATLPNKYEKYFESYQNRYISNDDVTTYPNINIGLSTFNSLINSENIFYNSILLGSDTSLVSQSITLNITKSGKYKIFIAVLDQFNQISVWCLTNKVNNYNIPF